MIRIRPAICGAAFFGLFATMGASQSTEQVGPSEDFSELPKEYIELFVDAVHSRELCLSSRGECDVPLQKWQEDYYLSVKGETSFLSQDVANAAKAAVNQVTHDIEVATGIALKVERTLEASNFISLVYVNEDEYRSDPESYIKARISRASWPLRENSRRAFERFLVDKVECFALSPRFNDGRIRFAQIWIKIDIAPENMSRCVAEEFFNAFGFGDGEGLGHDTIFSWPLSWHENGKLRLGYSPLHLAFLRRLYRPDLLANQTVQQTRERLGD